MTTKRNTSGTSKAKGGRTTPPKTVAPITEASEWAREGAERAKGKALTVPSGKTCLVRRPDGLKFFLDKGHVPNALLPIVQGAVNEHKKTSPEDLQAMVQENPDMLGAIIELADKVVIECVIQPEISPVPLDENGDEVPPHKRPDETPEDRNRLYIDYVDGDDRLFIFYYAVSGVDDVKPFRDGASESVAPV